MVTALSVAIYFNQLKVIKILLDQGAIKNKEEMQRVIDIADGRRLFDDEVYSLLRDFAKINFSTFNDRLNEIGFDATKLDMEEQKIYESILDPIMQVEIMNDPIAVSSGITYDRQSLQNWFSANKCSVTNEIPKTVLCPITKLPIHRNELSNKTHILTKNVISAFLSKQEIKFKNLLLVNERAICATNTDKFTQTQHITWSEQTNPIEKSQNSIFSFLGSFFQENSIVNGTAIHERTKHTRFRPACI